CQLRRGVRASWQLAPRDLGTASTETARTLGGRIWKSVLRCGAATTSEQPHLAGRRARWLELCRVERGAFAVEAELSGEYGERLLDLVGDGAGAAHAAAEGG